MIRKVQKTFDWEYLVRCLTAMAVLYVVGTVALHGSLGSITRVAIR